MLIIMTKGMRKKLDEVLQESVKNGELVFKPNLSRVDNEIVIAFHSSDALEITIENKTGH
jgi:hypothetical protein